MDWLAVSIQGEVEKYGAYVGIAAFFGLAVLSLLYFAQARELKRLREWAGRAPERAQELEARVVAQADAARQTAPVRRLAEMPVIPPPPPVPAATAAASAPEATAAPQATVEADVLEESDEAVGAPSTNGHHEGPVPPPETAVRAPDGEAAGDEEAAVPAAVAAGEAEAGQAEEPPAGEEGDRDTEDEATEHASAAEAATTDAEAAERGLSDAEDAEAEPSAADEAKSDPSEPQPAGSEAAASGAAVGAAAANEETRVHEPVADEATQVHGDADEAEREPVGATAEADAAPAAGESEGDAPEDEHGVDEPSSTAIPRATPVQRPLTAPRPAAVPLSRSQPSASPRRPGGVPPRRGATAAPGRERRSVGTVALLAGMAVLVMGAGAFAASQLLGGSEEPQQPNQTSQPATASATPTPAQQAGATPPAETVVAVLNGTTFNGLAGTIADQLGAAGYQRGATITNPDQTLQTSTVFFADGARANARRIARRLNVAEVRAADATTRALAPDADVIVLAGADQAP